MAALIQLVPFVALFGLLWLFMIRPARRRQQEASQMQSAVEPGTEIMLTSGIFGTVSAVNDEDGEITVEIAPGVEVRVVRMAIARVIRPEEDDEAVDAAAEADAKDEDA